MLIRTATPADLPAITAIYAHHVTHGTGSFELAPPGLAEMRSRFDSIAQAGFAYLVAEADGVVLGYAYVSHFRTRPAYRFTVEDSIYVAPGAVGRGVGRALLERLVADATAAGMRQMLAVIGDSANAGSIALHRACGFNHAGAFRDVGWKAGAWRDIVLMQRELGEGADTAPRDDSGQERHSALGPDQASEQRAG